MNVRLNIVLFIIAAILGGWFYSQQEPEKNSLEGLIKREGEADYSGRRMNSSVFDLNGKPQYYAEANEIKRYEDTGRTEFIKPMVNLFDENTAREAWKASADYGEVTKEKILNLQGKVILQALDPTSRLQRVETDKLTIDLSTQDIWTESEVKSRGRGFTTTGVGLKGNLKQQVAKILHNVKSYIEPITTKKNNKRYTIQNKDK